MLKNQSTISLTNGEEMKHVRSSSNVTSQLMNENKYN